MQMCNTVAANNGMPVTTLNNQIINNNNNSSSTSTANGNLVVDSIIKSTTNFAINDDSNGIKDAAKKSARVSFQFRLSFF